MWLIEEAEFRQENGWRRLEIGSWKKKLEIGTLETSFYFPISITNFHFPATNFYETEGQITPSSKTKFPASTQENLDIAGIEDGIIILKNGSYRLVLDVSAVNFGLKSEREQNSMIFQFQGFLNSLHSPIQILIQSRKLDLTPYLEKLKKRAADQPVELLRSQTLDYIDFVSELINLANIMKKRFYVIIGWENIELQKVGFVDKILNRGNSISLLKITEGEFKKRSDELRQRAGIVASGLGSIGLRCKQLSTKELIELFYNFYNPGISDKERLTDIQNVGSEVVRNQSQNFNIEKPHNTANESPIIDNESLVKEQDRLKHRAEEVEKKESIPAEKPAEGTPTTPAIDKKQDTITK